MVAGGKFARGYNGVDFLDRADVATVRDFYVDKYEVTVARVRVFGEHGQGHAAELAGRRRRCTSEDSWLRLEFVVIANLIWATMQEHCVAQ
ncbi:MAG: hypothetical protein WDO74_14995 [Pseudomonadota bacterium]